jgi:nucleotide-binding universal stress UspA family protein
LVTLPVAVEPTVSIDSKPLEQAGKRLLEKARDIAKQCGLDPQTKMETVFGNPAQAIVKAAEAGHFDLIVMGAKGHSLLMNVMVGSVADAVVHNAPCPVLVVR